MSFSTKIVHGGTGWRVAGGANGGYGPYFVLVSSGPQLASADLNLLPGNSLVAGFGFSIINQTILGSAPPQYFNLPITIVDNQWYKITTEIMSTGYNITIRGPNNVNANVFVLSAPFQSYVNTSWGSPTLVDGTFGFGPFIDQIAYYKNVSVVDANSTALYNNALTTDEVYAEYSVQTNPRAVCIDGAKRDRMVWIGDFVHTARMIATSTGRFDFIQSMIDFEFEWQFLDGPAAGLVAIQAPMGAGPQYKESYYPSEYNEDDYFIFFLVTIGDYFALTGDTALLGQHWNDTKFLVDTLTKRYIGSSGLLTNGNWFTAQGTDSATAPTALFAIALNQLVHVANALNDSATASSYITLSQELNAAINSHLWSPSLGAYSLSVPWAGDTSILATAFTIRAGIADTTKATTGILKLSDLFYQIGYKDSTRVSNGAYTQLSPNVQGFLLESLFLAHTKLDVPAAVVTPIIKTLVEVFWPKMVKQNQFYTGASWEYLYPDGSPGIGIFTSLNHPWGGAPTYVLTDYVLGLRRDFNATTQAYNWVMDPAWDIVNLLGLTSAQGKVPLLGGGYIEASWSAVTANGELSATRINATVTGAEGVEVLVKRQK
ncbi:Six-hairpin glycosidase-like protein [Calycina marina]|uniref:Six-hairpin glycosidase-like protein n=1 Tax=Calycina marina TaxID=1763456 RepID=A0A9P7YYB9_9HELO|nr:Six-hairpin glycosidase-like protein [Calycina marina]